MNAYCEYGYFWTELPSFNKPAGRYYIMNNIIAHPNDQISTAFLQFFYI